MYEFTGVVKRIGEVQTFSGGFSKRELVVVEDRAGEWENVVSFIFKKDDAAMLDGIVEGARVKIGFVVDGREWTDPKTGKVRCFSDLTGKRLVMLDGQSEVPEPADPGDAAFGAIENDKIPF